MFVMTNLSEGDFLAGINNLDAALQSLRDNFLKIVQ